ncbi:MAG: DUF1311 domain-containing protein [Nitratireductor sp.]|nr:DUF1311 domain-containing protein [Nitratireductor sp.]
MRPVPLSLLCCLAGTGPAIATSILILTTGPAQAFDCARATAEIDRAICGDDDARAANDRMETAYFSLRDRLGAEARRTLLGGQKDWLAWRDANCGPVALCLAEASASRAGLLGQKSDGMVPFFNWQQGDTRHYDVVLQGFRFADAATGSAEAAYNTWLDAEIADTPFGKPVEDDIEMPTPFYHEVDVEVTRLDNRLLSAVAWSHDYSGGAHPNSWTTSVTIDRQTGAELDAKALFGEDGLAAIATECARQIAAERSDSAEGEAVEAALHELEETYPGTVAAHATDMHRWHFSPEGATIRFDSYAIGPYVAGPSECRFGEDRIRALAGRPELFAPSN